MFFATNFPEMFLLQSNFPFYTNKNYPVYELFLKIIFPLRHIIPKGPVPGSKNLIPSQDSSPNTC